ncbi:MAG TPA: energy transducer TonB, partial [Kofleriaceae bacterium]|nr:energy transducer TonB [Kofleriaceae bacterium]
QVRRPSLPSELSGIILRAVASDRERRYHTADELRVALDQFAARAGLAASSSMIAEYMRKQFGERPEPWLELGDAPVESFEDARTAIGESMPSHSWTELGPSESDPQRGRTSTSGISDSIPRMRLPTAITTRIGADAPPREAAPPRPSLAQMPPPPTESKMGWESQKPAHATAMRHVTPVRIALVSAALILGVAIWRLGRTEHVAVPEVAVTPAVQPAPAPPPAQANPEPPRVAEVVATGTTGQEPEPTPPPEPPAPTRTTRSSPAGTRASARVAVVEPAPAPSPRSAPPPAASPSSRSTPPSSTPAPSTKPTSQPAAPVIAMRTTEAATAASEPRLVPPAPPPPAPVPSVAPPAPTPAPEPAAVAPQTVAPAELDKNRIAGDKRITPDENTMVSISRSGKGTLVSAYKVCIAADGNVQSVTQLRSTGFPAYDERILETIRHEWRYRPYLVNGKAAPVCTAVRFVYSQT